MRRFTLPRNWDFTADTPTNARKDFNHQLSRRLVDSFDEIAFEQLTIANMTRSAAGTLASPGTNVVAKSGLNRSIPGAGWGQLTEFTTYTTASAGGRWTRWRPHTPRRPVPGVATGCGQPRHLGPLLLHRVRAHRPRHAYAAKVALLSARDA